MISGGVFGILDAPGDTFGCLGQSLGTFFGIWTAPWGTFSDLGGSLGDLVAPNGFQNRLFWILDAFWAPFAPPRDSKCMALLKYNNDF